jgi:hypothetical protein
MVYSADTFNDPAGIENIHQAGFISRSRRDQLVNFPWHHSVILHEAGVPPIHTPLKTLTALPQHVKVRTCLRVRAHTWRSARGAPQDRLYVVHVAAKDLPADSGLKTAQVGPENTIVIVPYVLPPALALESVAGQVTRASSEPITEVRTKPHQRASAPS